MFSAQATCPECGYTLPQTTISHFSFNSPSGACQTCHGLGVKVAFVEDKLVNGNLSIAEGAVLPWGANTYYSAFLEAMCKKEKIDIHVPYDTLTQKEKDKILYGTAGTVSVQSRFAGAEKEYTTKYEGVIHNLERRFHDNPDPSDAYGRKIHQFVTEIECPDCNGYRLKKEFLSVFVNGKNIGELAALSVTESLAFFSDLPLSAEEQTISKSILKNIVERLEFLE